MRLALEEKAVAGARHLTNRKLVIWLIAERTVRDDQTIVATALGTVNRFHSSQTLAWS